MKTSILLFSLFFLTNTFADNASVQPPAIVTIEDSSSLKSQTKLSDNLGLNNFPKTLNYTAILSETAKLSSKQNHKVKVSYYKNNGQKALYVESFKKVGVNNNHVNLVLGTGNQKKGWFQKKNTYSSLQELFSHSPKVEMQINIDGIDLYPRVGILPAGHSQETTMLLESQKSGGKDKHWKGYKRKSSITTFQAATLSSKVYSSSDNRIKNPFQIQSFGPKISEPLINLSISEVKAFDDEVQETNKLRHEQLYDSQGRRFGTIAVTQDDLLAKKSQLDARSGLLTPAPSGGFEGMPRIDGVLPPDTEAAVGPNHIVQMVNSQMQIFDKAGNSLAGPGPINDLWNGFGGRCESDNDGDPIALYDEQADRWVLTQFAVAGAPESVCFAVSTSADPLGTYNLYQIVAQRFPDYYKLGVWPAANNNAYFMGTNSGQANQYDVYAIDRENMLLGNALRPTQFFQGFQNLLVPADNDGDLPPPDDEPGYFYTIRDSGDSYFNPSPANDSIDIYSFDVDWTTPANSTFTLQAVTSAEGLVDFNWTVCGFFVGNCIEQPTSAVLLDSNSWWPQQRFQYKNYGIYGGLVGVWGVNAVASPGKHTAPRWFEFRKYTPDLLWTLRQQGTYAPDATHRFSPSISMDESQNIGLGYSVTSTTVFPSIRYTIHDNDLDALGEMETEATMQAGGGSQTNSSGRWGDYSSMDVDPADGCTFWFTTEYISADTSANWQTYIGSFIVPDCKKHNILLFDDYTTAHEINVCKADDAANYDLAISYDFNTPTTMSVSGCPAGASCNYSANPITFPTTTTLQFSSLAAASSGAHPLTITATDGASKTDTESLTLNLFDSLAASPSLVSPSNNGYSGSLTPNLSWSSLGGAQSYTVEVDDDPAFGSIDFTSTVNGLNVDSGTLAIESCYYWRVAPGNLCGSGPASSAFNFYTPGVQAQTAIASTDVPINIPTTTTPTDHFSTLAVAGIGFINDVNLLNLDITHTYVGDLEMVLTSPSGTSVVLMSQTDNNNFCAGNNNVDISLDDEVAAGAWPCSPSGNGGTYQPSNPLSAFDGENADGTWTLNVKDPFNGDGGSINGWSLEFESFVDTGNTCPSGFTVGGNVSGLTGSGLVLQNNLSDNLAVAADGSFTFITPLADLDAYSVTVLTQPSSPSQTCNVTNATGNIAGADVVNVSVSCTDNPDITFSGTNLTQNVCINPGPTAITPVTLTTTALGGYSNTINLAFNPILPTGISGGFGTNTFIPATVPGTDSTLNLSVDNTASAGLNTITVEASGTGITTKSVDVDLNVVFALNSGPVVTTPVNSSTGVVTSTSFVWAAVAGALSYDIEISTDPSFVPLFDSANVASTSYTPGPALADSTVYYWRVRTNNLCGSSSYSLASFETAAVLVSSPSTTCNSPALAITDNTGAGVDDMLTIIAPAGTISDIDISLDVAHGQVGDLIATVTNGNTATSVIVMDRPGYTGTGGGCNRNNIITTLDDGAGTAVENVCVNADPTIGAGPFSPFNPLSAFNSEAFAGTWTLNISDNRNQNTGTLDQWCVIAIIDEGLSLNPADYSDLSSSYGVARHEGGGTSRLGNNWTADTSYVEDGDAPVVEGGNGDDDGIVASGAWTTGSPTAVLAATVSTAGYLSCWFDWDDDGSFAAGEESIATVVVVGANNFSVTVPVTSFGSNGDDFLETRCRFYDAVQSRAPASPLGTAASGEVEDYKLPADQLTPVTLAYTKSTRSNSGFSLNWSTTTESGTIGFNVYGLANNVWKQLNSQPISAKGMNSVSPHDYQFNTGSNQIESYKIEELTIKGVAQSYGPYATNVTYGKYPNTKKINWQSITQESNLRASNRQNSLKLGFDFIKISVDQTGIQRITYEDLVSLGVDWQGISADDISLSFESNSIARKVSDDVFGPGSYIDFIGVAANTLYTKTNIYLLKLDANLVNKEVAVTDTTFNLDTSAYHMATSKRDEDVVYSFASPTSSPWFLRSMLVYTSAKDWSYPINVPYLINNNIPSKLTVEAWGGTDWPQIGDHHLQILLDNQFITEVYSDGTDLIKSSEFLNHNQVAGVSSITFRLPADTGVDYDLIQLDHFSLDYPSEIYTINDKLSFVPVINATSNADIVFSNGFENNFTDSGFLVKGLSTQNNTIYAYDGTNLYDFPLIQINSTVPGYELEVPMLNGSGLKYFINTNNNIVHPQLDLANIAAINLSQQYDYLMISHPDFIDTLNQLVSYHQARGLSVLVVNVEDIYAQYSFHRIDANAIQGFIKDASLQSGIQTVLLVGSDTSDYLNNLNIGSKSFIPTLYYPTDDIVRYAPVDTLFVDTNNNLIPDLSIGRLPVRTNLELQNIIDKIMLYANRSYIDTAVFTTDRSVSFDGFSNQMVDLLPPNWQVDKAYINTLEINGAQSALIHSIESGVSLTSFFGHSGPNTWSFEHLFDNNDILALNNLNKPTLVNQFGCWNTYYVMPEFDTMAHNFMSLENKGAVAVLGASTLTQSNHESLLGNILIPKMAQSNVPTGLAILQAKQALAASHPDYLDVILGWTLLGDPMTILNEQ